MVALSRAPRQRGRGGHLCGADGIGKHEVAVYVATPTNVANSKEFRIVVEDKKPAG